MIKLVVCNMLIIKNNFLNDEFYIFIPIEHFKFSYLWIDEFFIFLTFMP
jgi:hypothetical protein